MVGSCEPHGSTRDREFRDYLCRYSPSNEDKVPSSYQDSLYFFGTLRLSMHLFLCQWSNITAKNRIVLEQLIIAHLIINFLSFYGIWRFISMLSTARHWSLCRTNLVKSTSLSLQPESSWSILKLPSHLSLGVPNGSFPSHFPTTIL